jgi:hypothetical protein
MNPTPTKITECTDEKQLCELIGRKFYSVSMKHFYFTEDESLKIVCFGSWYFLCSAQHRFLYLETSSLVEALLFGSRLIRDRNK